MRLFVAVDPPAEVVADLVETLQPLYGKWPGLRWTPPKRWHLTLAFLGEVDDARCVPLGGRLARAAGRHAPLTAQLRGAGTFPQQAAKARVLWTGVGGSSEKLAVLAGSVAAAARRSGIAVDHLYRSHLTLARARTPLDVTDLVAALAGYVGPAWTVGELCLVRSHLGPRPRHEQLECWPLAASPAAS